MIEENQNLLDDKTLLESDRTILEKKSENEDTSHRLIQNFRDYSIVNQLTQSGGEADIFVISKFDKEFILKLYRYGISIKEEVLKKTFEISKKNSKNLVKIFESGFDSEHKRWYEILEYLPHGTFNEHKKAFSEPPAVLSIITEINNALNVLHKNNIIHRDLKPSNILIRSLKPLNLVITDFGISSVLDADLSRKMTGIEGTPNYWSPESISGVVGKEADYWALGMIVLELLHGSHPFSMFDMKVIMYTLSTKGVEIPNDLPEKFIPLIKGLLTRDPEYRWSFEHISRWINGEKDIPVYYEEFKEKRRRYNKPYKFHEKKYYSLEALFESFFKDEICWEDGCVHLHKGYIDKWLEENEDFDRVIALEKIRKTSGIDPDLKMLKYLYTFMKEAPFVFNGKLINIPNLCLYSGRILNEENTREEEKIITHLLNNKLIFYFDHYLELTGKKDDILSSLFEIIGKMSSDMNNYNFSLKKGHSFLSILYSIQDYLLPFQDSGFTSEKLEFIYEHMDSIIKKDFYEKIISEYVVPEGFQNLDNTSDKDKYLEVVSVVNELKRKNLFISIKKIEEIKNEMIIPDALIDTLNTDDIQKYMEIAEVFKEFVKKRIFIDKRIFNELDIKNIIPESIRTEINSGDLETYHKAVQNLRKLEDEFMLISREQIKFLKKNDLLNNMEIREIQEKDLNDYNQFANHIRSVEWDMGIITDHEIAILGNKFILPVTIQDSITAGVIQKKNEFVKKLRELQKSKNLIRKDLFERLKTDFIVPQDVIKGIFDEDIDNYVKSSRRIHELFDEDLLFTETEFEEIKKQYIIPEKIIESINSSQYVMYIFGARQLKDMRNTGQLIERIEYNNMKMDYFIPEVAVVDFEGKDVPKYILANEKLQFLKSENLLIPKGKIFESNLAEGGFKIKKGCFIGDFNRYLKAAIMIKSSVNQITKGKLRTILGNIDKSPMKSGEILHLKRYLDSLEQYNTVWEEEDRKFIESLYDVKLSDYVIVFFLIFFIIIGIGNYILGLSSWYVWMIPFIIIGVLGAGLTVMKIYLKRLYDCYFRNSKWVEASLEKSIKLKKEINAR